MTAEATSEEPVFTPRPMPEYLDDAVRLFADRPALDFMGKGWTYKQLGDLVNRAAEGFRKLGVKRGVHVGICLPNTPYFTVCYFAILKAGGTVVNYNPLYVEREIDFQARDSHTEIMVTLDLKVIYDKVEAVRAKGGLKQIVVCPMADILPQPKKLLFQLFKRGERAKISRDDAHPFFADLVNGRPIAQEAVTFPETDVAVLQYTGGTTGVPKGAMLSHANLSANMEQMRIFFSDARPGDEVMLCVLPFFHVFAMTAAQNLSILIGAEMVLMPRFELKTLLDDIKRKSVTLFPGVPTIYTAINNSPLTHNYDLTSIRMCLSGGAPLPVEVKENFEKLTGCTLVEGYGLTEASPVVSCNPSDEPPRAGSIGKPLAWTECEFRSLEDPYVVMPEGEKGELCVRGPQVMMGYWERPDDTNRTVENGFLHTGDVGYRDEDGYIHLVDRIKDLIICSGYNVYPRVIEEAIYQNEAVEEVIVIAIEDDYRGQAPKAFIKLKEGATITPDELKVFLKEHLSAIEMPRAFEFRDELPKTLVGKLSKKELVEEERAKASDQAAE
ncbi:long-chain fatty acid--CoA ligase [Breoghania sp.]|uniref:long-chain-fatty-acid--CoA ligase n=1 Tax=Breoghania sp. TaxID=2065378 RepID=UPI0029CA1223|nr:long-chain fatty acid--CoA ligase [Breoghania sp.]